MRDSRLMNNIMYGCAHAYNVIHQSHVLDNVRAVFPNRINTFAGMQCSATRKCKSFAQTLPLGGSGNQTSNVLDHAKSEQHVASMARLQEERAHAHFFVHAPITRSLAVLDDLEKERVKHKFDICYVLAREGLAFLKYPVFHCVLCCQTMS